MRRILTVGILTVMVCLLWTQTLAGRRQSQLEMNQEAYRNFEKADKELNTVYSKLSKALDPMNSSS